MEKELFIHLSAVLMIGPRVSWIANICKQSLCANKYAYIKCLSVYKGRRMCIHTYAHENIKPLGHKDKWQRDALTNQTVP